jgi:hypothetical protein
VVIVGIEILEMILCPGIEQAPSDGTTTIDYEYVLSHTTTIVQTRNVGGILAWEYWQCTKFQSRMKPKLFCEGQ